MDDANRPINKGTNYNIDAYLDWVEKEGIPVAEDYGIDLFQVETKMWDRYGVKGAAVHMIGRGDLSTCS